MSEFDVAWFMLGMATMLFIIAVFDIIRTAAFLLRLRQLQKLERERIERGEMD